jgi:hypothetical protein
MQAIGVHTYGGRLSNFACPLSPEILNAFSDIASNPPNPLYSKNRIDYTLINIPSGTIYPRPIPGIDAIPHTLVDDNLDGLYREDLPSAKCVKASQENIPPIVVSKAT